MSESVEVEFFGRRAKARRAGETRPRGRVAVVGAGIVGSSIAYHLARRGAEVVVFEKRRPAAGATWDSFAWINATFDKRSRSYFELNRLGVLGYQHLEDPLGALRIDWGGSVQWFGDDAGAEWLREQVRRHRAWGYDTRLIGQDELTGLEPQLVPGAVTAAAYSADEGSVDPVAATRAFLDAARAAGAILECPVEVAAVERRVGRLAVRTRAGESTADELAVDVLVVAAGDETDAVAAMAGAHLPLAHSSGLLAHSAPVAHGLSRVILAPTAHMVQRADGSVVTGKDFGGQADDTSSGQGAALLAEAAKYLPALATAGLDRLGHGRRPMPRDGLPAAGFAAESPGVYLAVADSGITLAPILGRLAAAEILDGLRFELLEDYRPSRFGKD